ncbi:MAG: cob(I)yrinic acid a,c-diamide adenosyltransferase [Candidatus Niyogibacteria bacterium]|nr:cob(I)yrinic acid a,c-diamide adenosyltransferase [Candidatus Niyogibacteria bacterium]
MLYTRRGDKGKTTLYCCQEKLSKSAAVIEAMGTLDELCSLLGVVKVAAKKDKFVAAELHEAQENIFTIQAMLAGANKKFGTEKIVELEATINAIEKKLPPIKSFMIPGGTELGALLDYARAVCRRAERRAVALPKKYHLSAEALIYLNRLSSLLYALARLANCKIKEKAPTYQ